MAVWLSLAGALGCLTSMQRSKPLPLLGWLLILVTIRQAIVGFPLVAWTDWTHAWGILASMGSAWCWLIAVAFGVTAAVRSAHPLRKLPLILFWLLSLNVAAFFLQKVTGLGIWLFQEHKVGLFLNGTTWAAWSAISVPILWSWRRWAILPALIGLSLSGSTSAWLALAAGMFWLTRGNVRWPVYAVAGVILLTGLWLFDRYMFLFNVQARLDTWLLTLSAILSNPLGIGWHVMAYANAIRQYAGALPHPGSDVLRLILECGWLAIPILFGLVSSGLKRLGTDALSTALVICAALACIQNALSTAQIGALALIVWLNWYIREDSCGTAC